MTCQELAQDTRGAMLVTAAVALGAIFLMAVLAVDGGLMLEARHQLQNVADGGGVGAARLLGQQYERLAVTAQKSLLTDGVDATVRTHIDQNVGQANQAGGQSITLITNDIEIGQWVGGGWTAGASPPNAVRITARRDGTANTPFQMFFARMMGTTTIDLRGEATAALTSLKEVPSGAEIQGYAQDLADAGTPIQAPLLGLPIGISRSWFPTGGGVPAIPTIVLNTSVAAPLTGSCTAWHNFTRPAEPLADTVTALVGTIERPTPSQLNANTPATGAGQTNYRIGGDAHDWAALDELYRGMSVDPGEPSWLLSGVLLAVYDDSDCISPTIGTQVQVVGFASATVSMTVYLDINGDPIYIMSVQVQDDAVSVGRGGNAAFFGTRGSIPQLVR